MNDKPTINIEGWYMIAGNLYGQVHNHPRFDNGTLVKTSRIVSEPSDEPAKEGDTVETLNSMYILGEPGKKRDEA